MTAHQLFVARDPSRVASWCREHLAPGTVYVAPSAASRAASRRALLGGRGVGVGARIVTAGGLVNLLEARAGLPGLDLVSGALSRLMLLDAGRKAGVPLFGSSTPAGAIAALGSLVRSLRLNGATAEGFRAAGGDSRAADAVALYEAQRAALGLADEADRLERIAVAMPRLGTVVLEDPIVSSAAFANVMRAIAARADAMFVGLPALAASPSDARFSDGADRAAGGLSAAPGTRLSGPAERARAFFVALGCPELRDEAAPPTPEMEALGGVGSDGEVALVARRILRLVRDGTPPERILGAAPNSAYLSHLHEACARVGVPIASPRRVPAVDTALVRALVAAFTALADPEQDTAERGLIVLGTPHLGLSPSLHDRVHRRLTLAGQGALRSWKADARLPGGHPAARLAADVDEIAASLAAPQAPIALATLMSRLVLHYRFLASARRHYLAAGRDDLLRGDQQAWELLQAAFDEVADAFERSGRATVAAGEWLAEVTTSLARSTVRLDQRGVRGVHLTVIGGGLPDADHVFAVGWREGVFPRRPREDALLPDAVMARLNLAGAILSTTADVAAHEEERRERVVRAARMRLAVSWPQVAADGSPQLRSFFAQDVGVPDVGPDQAAAVGRTTWLLGLCSDRAESLARAAVLAHHPSAADLGTERQDLDRLLGSLDAAEARALGGALQAPGRIEVPEDMLPYVRAAAGKQSATQARTLAQCRYRYFAERRLEIERLAEPALDELRVGGILHRVLAALVLEAAPGVAGSAAFDPSRAAEILDREWAHEVPESVAADPQSAFRRQVLRDQLRRLVAHERELLQAVDARPAHAELAFGLGTDHAEARDPASLPDGLAFALPAGSIPPSVVLRGSIDRVDLVEVDGRRFGVAVDYKSGKGESHAKKFREGADFQLPIYCEMMRLAGIEPVGAMFLGLPDGARHGIVREDFARHFPAGAGDRLERLPPAAFQARLDESLVALGRLLAQAAVSEIVLGPRDDDCEWCELAPLCRIQSFETVGTGGGDA